VLQIHGQKLRANETIFFRDGDIFNCSYENLVIRPSTARKLEIYPYGGAGSGIKTLKSGEKRAVLFLNGFKIFDKTYGNFYQALFYLTKKAYELREMIIQ
jgi:hypothetical protein